MDELGWKKVICDVREHMPVSIKIPSIVRKKNPDSNIDDGPDSRSTDFSTPSGILESRDVANAFSNPEDVLTFPLGHNTIVAVEKHRMTASVFKGGRPLMDGLAKEIVEEILAWNGESTYTS